MKEIAQIITYSLFAGITVFFGGLLGKVFEKVESGPIKDNVVHGAVAFGGGILIAAVAFVLTPKAIDLFAIQYISIIFLSGAFSFFLIDRYLEQKGGAAAQLMAMLMDFIPEAIALGAVFARNRQLGLLLAVFIGLQNFPESFNAYSDLRKSGFASNKILLIFLPLSLIGIFAALLGVYLLTDSPKLIAALMLFSAGGILYLIFQDIAPLSKMKNHWLPALGATIGFLVGMIGTKILG
ncbi:MAG: divalent cation transporter [Candidatus Omnitrophota bacterium]